MFNELITTQISLEFIKKYDNNTLNYTKLLKMLYLLDRKLLEKYGYRATYDTYFNMKNGVVLSNTYNLIKNKYKDSFIWKKTIGTKDTDVFMIEDAIFPIELEQNIINEIDAIEKDFHNKPYGALIELHHTFNEWKNVSHSYLEFQSIIDSLNIDEETKEKIQTFEKLNNSYNK